MLIPNIFKADIVGDAKGNIKAEDLASLVAFAYPKQAGILKITDTDCLGTVTMISQNPPKARITINKGYIVVFGRLITIEQGTTIDVDLPVSSEETGYIGVKIDLLQSGANEVTWFIKQTALVTENLLQKSSTGVYEFALYSYQATPSGLTINLTSQKIENIDDYLKGANFTTQAEDDNSTKLATTEFVANAIENTKEEIGENYISKNYDKLQYGSSTGQAVNIKDIANYKEIVLEAKANNRWGVTTVPIDLMLDEISLYGYVEICVYISSSGVSIYGAIFRFTRNTVTINGIGSAVYSIVKGIK